MDDDLLNKTFRKQEEIQNKENLSGNPTKVRIQT